MTSSTKPWHLDIRIVTSIVGSNQFFYGNYNSTQIVYAPQRSGHVTSYTDSEVIKEDLHPVLRGVHVTRMQAVLISGDNVDVRLKVKVGEEVEADVCFFRLSTTSQSANLPLDLTFKKGDDVTIRAVGSSRDIPSHSVTILLTGHYLDNEEEASNLGDVAAQIINHADQVPTAIKKAIVDQYVQEQETDQGSVAAIDTCHIDQVTATIKKKIITQYMEEKLNNTATNQSEVEPGPQKQIEVDQNFKAAVENLFKVWKNQVLSEYLSNEMKKMSDALKEEN